MLAFAPWHALTGGDTGATMPESCIMQLAFAPWHACRDWATVAFLGFWAVGSPCTLIGMKGSMWVCLPTHGFIRANALNSLA